MPIMFGYLSTLKEKLPLKLSLFLFLSAIFSRPRGEIRVVAFVVCHISVGLFGLVSVFGILAYVTCYLI